MLSAPAARTFLRHIRRLRRPSSSFSSAPVQGLPPSLLTQAEYNDSQRDTALIHLRRRRRRSASEERGLWGGPLHRGASACLELERRSPTAERQIQFFEINPSTLAG